MGNRPYYIITHTVDYDGYGDYFDYIGVNAKAAKARFGFLYRDLRRIYYEENGAGRINGDLPDVDVELLENGRVYTAYLNDDDQCWIGITLRKVATGVFQQSDGGVGDGYRREDLYKREFPNAKY